jgi:integrase
MNYTQPQPVVTVRLRRSENKKKEAWNLVLEIINVVRDGKYTKIFEAVHRTITTPIWDKRLKTTRGTYLPMRNSNGVILCESEIDQEACVYADKVRQKRQHDFDLSILYDGYEDELDEQESKRRTDVVSYFYHVAENRHPNDEGAQYNWKLSASKLEQFLKGRRICFDDLDIRLINDYRSFLLNMHNGLFTQKKNEKVSSNTAARHFMFFRAILHQAYNEGYLDIDLSARTTAIPKAESMRDAFTAEEIDALAAAPCKDPVLKRAALFSCLTGMRLGDIRKLRWKHIVNVNGSWKINFKQGKTSVVDYLPISGQAFDICGTPKDGEEHVFPGIKQTAYFKKTLNKWLAKAGVTRHMTFHCFRHTFATLQLEHGTDIYTIKSMLGHTSVNTTMVYSHIVDDRKRKAMNGLFIEDLNIND